MTNADLTLRARRDPSPALIAGAILLALAAGAIIEGTPRRAAHPATWAAHVNTMAGAASGITADIVSDEDLAHVPGKRVIVEVVEFPPGASVPEHHHGGSVTVYILSGTIRSRLDAGPILDYPAEATFFEPPGAVHTLTQNPSAKEPARFMAIHVIDDGAALTTYH